MYAINFFFGMLIRKLDDMWILDYWVFDIFFNMWMLVDLNVRYFVIKLSSLCIFFLDRNEEIMTLCLLLGQKMGDITIIILDIGYWISTC